MIKRIKEIYAKEQFIPTFISLFINPFYFIRKGLFRGINLFAHNMRGVMLDFGCGCKPYRGLFNVEKYIGVDIRESGHNHENEDIDIYYDGKILPFKNNYFDSFFCSEVFEHIFNLEDIMPEISRVLKPNSVVLITVPFVWNEHEKPFDFARYTSFGLSYILKKYGFRVLNIYKSTNDIETIFQMIAVYVFQKLLPKNKYLNLFLTVILMSPINIIGIILSKILPRNFSFYSNNIVLAEKGSRKDKVE